MIIPFKKNISRNLNNFLGWKTKRKIVVIESDDWGSVRMPSKSVYVNLLKKGIRVDLCHYNRFDSLESENDLTQLFDVLVKYKDKNGNHPIFTANYIIANPDFEKIRNSFFREYYFELFTETLKKYPNHQNSFTIINQGINQKVFFPQFHGREHLNVNRWMNSIKNGTNETRMAFDNNLYGISTKITSENRKSYMAALEFEDISELTWQKQMLSNGLNLFDEIFGYKSMSFIAPNYTWSSELEMFLADVGIKYFQGSGNQINPTLKGNLIMKHSLGSQNNYGQYYLTRNCIFEPTEDFHKDWLKSVINEIASAFFWGKPAIIESHRVNYIGAIDSIARSTSLLLLDQLLAELINRWPSIEFMNSVELGRLISNEK